MPRDAPVMIAVLAMFLLLCASPEWLRSGLHDQECAGFVYTSNA
jgi:hypothetical protein